MRVRNNLPLKIAIFASGEGTNAEAILDYNFVADKKTQKRDVDIVALFCNKRDAKVIEKFESRKKSVPIGKAAVRKPFKGNVHMVEWNKQSETREAYDARLSIILLSEYPDVDLVVLAGWMHVLSADFLKRCQCPVINLHPALPGKFPGAHAMRDAWNAFKRGVVTHTGIMVHFVDPGIDTGKTIHSKQVPMLETDDFTRFETRMKTEEKQVLIDGIQMMINYIQRIYGGKVRDLYMLDQKPELMMVRHSDRLSAFDKHVCSVPEKGMLLCNTAAWWFNQTKDIISNHYLYHSGSNMVVRRTSPIALEVVVRGYLTGNSPTSIWTMYNDGKREMYGHKFPDGMKKNMRLFEPIITPTTKGEHDHPITSEEIIEQGILTKTEWDYIRVKAMELYNRGTELAGKAGLIIADTKYEFGFLNGQIILIDEIHTPDSSRYWYHQSYEANMLVDDEPTKLDKDQIRDYLKANPEETNVPGKLLFDTLDGYKECYVRLTGSEMNEPRSSSFVNAFESYLYEYAENIVVILAGSRSDAEFVKIIQDELTRLGTTSTVHYASAHKEAEDLLEILGMYIHRRVVYITVAGMSNALSGFVAGNQPGAVVIACPPFKSRADLQIDIYSSLMMPSNVPSMTVISPKNAAQAAARILTV